MNYPNTVVLAYHGANSDPWQTYSAGIRGLFGFSSYQSGVVGRKTGVISYSAWNNEVVLQTLLVQPGVSISVSSKNYDAASRTLTATVVITALTDLNGTYNVNYVLTENNLIYPQTGNSSCTGGGNYVHDHAVKSMINGDQGELVISGSWTTGQQITKTVNYVLPSAPQVTEPNNCDLNIFVYAQGSSISTNSNIQQSMRTSVTGTTGIVNNNTTPVSYSLTQNYPNPFNPNTNFTFSIPKSGNVSLKFYNMLGNEIETYVNGFLTAGTYGVEFDGSKYASGIYFYTLTTDNFTETKKMNLIK
ncbi:MAG: Omp28-related outer membrane protein [Ignavibacteria bacterium]|nr:Omp28-related outer membrane protein [Ignavibacteria bacterium]